MVRGITDSQISDERQRIVTESDALDTLQALLPAILGRRPFSDTDLSRPVADLGLDSIEVYTLTAELEDQIGEERDWSALSSDTSLQDIARTAAGPPQ